MAEPLILSEKRDISKCIYYFGLNQARQLAVAQIVEAVATVQGFDAIDAKVREMDHAIAGYLTEIQQSIDEKDEEMATALNTLIEQAEAEKEHKMKEKARLESLSGLERIRMHAAELAKDKAFADDADISLLAAAHPEVNIQVVNCDPLTGQVAVHGFNEGAKEVARLYHKAHGDHYDIFVPAEARPAEGEMDSRGHIGVRAFANKDAGMAAVERNKAKQAVVEAPTSSQDNPVRGQRPFLLFVN